MSDNEGVTSTNMVFTLSYSFKAKSGQLAYLKNDYDDSAKEKHKLLRSTSQSQLFKESGLTFPMPTLGMRHHLKHCTST